MFCSSIVTAAVAVQDDEGSIIELQQPATRIVSLAPSLTELLFAVGAGAKLVGVVEYSDFPPAATQIQIVGRHDMLDLERILSLAPDLIVAWQTGNPRASVNRLRELGLTVYVAEPKRLDSIPAHMARLGTLAGSEAVASRAVTTFNSRLQDLQTRFSNATPVSTFYQVWDAPLITAGGNELINDIISLCGGRNIFSNLQMVAPKVNREAVLQGNPDVIVASGIDMERPEWLDDWRAWPSLTAVSRDQLFVIPPALLQRHTPRALEGAEMMCELLESTR